MMGKIYEVEGSGPCDQCDVVSINGIATHEIGCPNADRDPISGKPYEVQCFICGFEFIPDPGQRAICYDCKEFYS